jgi:fumarate hydratase class II
LPVEKRDDIAAVCDEILAGKLDDQFPLVTGKRVLVHKVT